MEEAEQTHSRGELEIALWQTFTQGDRGPKVDRTFKGRIQKLLDLDRAGGFGAPSEFAFHAAAPPGRGQEVHFTLLDAFCLAIGLDLLDVGFKQSEVVFLLCHLRKDLAVQLESIQLDPPILRAHLDQGDARCFMVLRKVEITETIGVGRAISQPMLLEPLFLNGPSGSDFLADMGYNNRLFRRSRQEYAELAAMADTSSGRKNVEPSSSIPDNRTPADGRWFGH